MSRVTKTGRFIYAGPYKTQEKADEVLADMYASGDALPGEDVKIETIRVRGAGRQTRYVITHPAG